MNTVDVFKHVIVPKTNDAPTVLVQPCGTTIVAIAVGMLAAVDFDGQFDFETREIGDERSDRTLAAKLQSGETAVAEDRPQTLFRFRRIAAQLAGVRVGHRERLLRPPS